MTSKRLERNKTFNQFLETAEDKFKSFKDENERAQYFEKIYSFYAVSGGRIGGLDKRIFEVFFGNRPFDSIHRNLEQKNLFEDGSTLMIQITDTGLVHVSIFPAKTEFRSLEEDSITLYKSIEPDRLLSDSFLRKIWKVFLEYTEYTSLDGQPTYWQKKRVQLLRYRKNLVISGKEQESRLGKLTMRLIVNTLTIGFSGFLIFVISFFFQKSNESKTIKRLEQLEYKIIQIDSNRVKKEDFYNALYTLDSLNRTLVDTVYVSNLENKNGK